MERNKQLRLPKVFRRVEKGKRWIFEKA